MTAGPNDTAFSTPAAKSLSAKPLLNAESGEPLLAIPIKPPPPHPPPPPPTPRPSHDKKRAFLGGVAGEITIPVLFVASEPWRFATTASSRPLG